MSERTISITLGKNPKDIHAVEIFAARIMGGRTIRRQLVENFVAAFQATTGILEDGILADVLTNSHTQQTKIQGDRDYAEKKQAKAKEAREAKRLTV